MDWKALLTSKTIWGLLIAALAPLLAKHGIIFDQASTVADIVSVAGIVLAAYGRATASGPLVQPPNAV